VKEVHAEIFSRRPVQRQSGSGTAGEVADKTGDRPVSKSRRYRIGG
jgi:hypothetical protein